MHLGSRSIRSSGARSGSVEVTLPPNLRALAGVRCEILLRDGHRPEIVLAPDLKQGVAALSRLWARLTETLGCADAAGELPVGELAFLLLPAERDGTEAASDAPHPIAWLDALALAAPPPHEPGCLARCLAGLAGRCGTPLGLDPALTKEWGAALGFAASGTLLDPSWRETSDLAGSVLARVGTEPGAAFARTGSDAHADRFWSALDVPLHALVEAYQRFTRSPGERDAIRAAWRRGLFLELSGA